MKPTDATRATAEAMPEINRRRFLTGTAMAGAVVAIAAPVAAAEPVRPLVEPHVHADDYVSTWGKPCPKPTPQERFDMAVRELKRAVKAIDPSVADWIVEFATDDDLDFRFMAIASSKPVA